jgi:predicted GNAT family acetyltransferase
MEEEYKIQLRLDADGKGGFYIDRGADIIARMEIEVRDGTLIVFHTEVDESLKGQNIGKKLLEEMVNYARQNELKVFPYCPFVKAQFRRHESDYADVWKKELKA